MTKSKRKTRASKKKDPFSDERAVFGPNSKLLKVNLTDFFLSPLAWENLTEAQRKDLKAKFPPHVTLDDSGKPSFEFLKYDMNWQSDLRCFKENLEDGRYEQEWLEEAHQAMKDRADGKFDAWKLEQYEEFWGQKAEYDDHKFSGALDEIQLEHLIADGAFEEGDIWFYSRAFGKGKKGLLVELDVRLDQIDDFGRLKFIVAKVGNISPTKRSHDEAFDTACATRSKGQSPTKTLKLEEGTTDMHIHSGEASSTPTLQHVEPKGLGLLPHHRQEDTIYLGTVSLPSRVTRPTATDNTATQNALSQAQSSPLDNHAELERPTNSTISSDSPVDSINLDQQKTPGSASKQMDMDDQTKTTVQEDGVSIASTESPRPYNTRRNPAPRNILDPSTPVKAREIPSPRKPQFPLTIRVDSPEELEKSILNADGRRKWDSRSNSWKRFHCKRDGKDLGCLWDLRERYWLQKNEKTTSKNVAGV